MMCFYLYLSFLLFHSTKFIDSLNGLGILLKPNNIFAYILAKILGKNWLWSHPSLLIKLLSPRQPQWGCQWGTAFQARKGEAMQVSSIHSSNHMTKQKYCWSDWGRVLKEKMLYRQSQILKKTREYLLYFFIQFHSNIELVELYDIIHSLIIDWWCIASKHKREARDTSPSEML